MSLSARLLGEKFGLTAQEMNRVLVKRGILSGTQGNYVLTELGKEYATVKDFHRGCGGYDHYNRYWETTSYDESVINILNVSEDVRISAIKEEKEYRAMQRAQRALEMAASEAEQLTKEKAVIEQLKKQQNFKKTGIVILVSAGVIATGVAVYKITKAIKKHRAENNQTLQSSDKEDNVNNHTLKKAGR